MVEDIAHQRVYRFVCSEYRVEASELSFALFDCILLRLVSHCLVLVVYATECCLVEVQIYHATFVEHRSCSTICHRLRHIVNIYVVAKHLACRTVFLRNRRTRKADVCGIRQRVSHSSCCSHLHSTLAVNLLGQSVLATMRLIGHNHDISACRERLLALLELLHRGEEYAIRLTLAQQFSEVLATLGLYGRLTQKIGTLRKLSEQLTVEVVAVGQNHYCRRRHRLLQSFGEEYHRQRLARALRVPKNATLTVGLRCFGYRIHRLAYGEELVVTCENFCALLFILREADETSQNLNQPRLVEHSREQHIKGCVAVYFACAVNGFPLHKAVLAGGYRADFRGRHITHHAECVVDK